MTWYVNVCQLSLMRDDSETYAFGADGCLVVSPKLLNGALIVSQILLAGNQEDGESTAKVLDLREPLFRLSCFAQEKIAPTWSVQISSAVVLRDYCTVVLHDCVLRIRN